MLPLIQPILVVMSIYYAAIDAIPSDDLSIFVLIALLFGFMGSIYLVSEKQGISE